MGLIVRDLTVFTIVRSAVF